MIVQIPCLVGTYIYSIILYYIRKAILIQQKKKSGLIEKNIPVVTQEWHLSMLFFVELNKTNEVKFLVNNLFLFRRFDDHGHHYQEK